MILAFFFFLDFSYLDSQKFKCVIFLKSIFRLLKFNRKIIPSQENVIAHWDCLNLDNEICDGNIQLKHPDC